jgi:uncharacterized protein (DUF58 family)
MTAITANRLFATLFYPLQYIRSQLRKPFDKFIESRSGPFSGPVELNSHRVYILPTRVGIIFTLLLLFLLLGSINYTKSLGFMLTFLLASLGIVGMLMTWRTLAGLKVTGLGASPVFAGQVAAFTVEMENSSADCRYAISVASRTQVGDTVDIDPGSIATARFNQLLEKRGYQNPGRIKLMTEFPLGLFIAWTWVDLSMHCLVYPVPATTAPTIPSIDSQSGEEQAEGVGLEDFAGLRKFQQGDSWRRISWKAAARLDELYSKEFTGGQPERQWIDWLTIDEASQEVRLSIMTRLVLDAQQAGRQYGLRLPGLEIKPDNGSSHQHHCLKALALYRLEE